MREKSRYALCALVAGLYFAAPAFAWDVTIINNNAVNEPGFQIVSQSPYDNESVDAPPQEVTLEFTLGIRPDQSYIKVMNAYGQRVSEEKLTGGGTRVSVALPPDLPPGAYTVRWKVVCICDARTELSDRYRFKIK